MDTTEFQPIAQSDGSSSRKSRRTFTHAQKRAMVEATLDGKTSVSVVARQHDVNANQLFRWRKQYHEGQLSETTEARLLPVYLKESDAPMAAASSVRSGSALKSNSLEIVLRTGHRIVVTGTVCQQSLQTVLQALS